MLNWAWTFLKQIKLNIVISKTDKLDFNIRVFQKRELGPKNSKKFIKNKRNSELLAVNIGYGVITKYRKALLVYSM